MSSTDACGCDDVAELRRRLSAARKRIRLHEAEAERWRASAERWRSLFVDLVEQLGAEWRT